LFEKKENGLERAEKMKNQFSSAIMKEHKIDATATHVIKYSTSDVKKVRW